MVPLEVFGVVRIGWLKKYPMMKVTWKVSMVNFVKLKASLRYARLGLISLSAIVAPVTVVAQELCALEMLEDEPDADALLANVVEFLDVLETNGVVAFEGQEGRVSIDSARRSLQDGIGSVSLLSCVVMAESIEFSGAGGNTVIACGGGASSLFPAESSSRLGSASLFCASETASFTEYLSSEG